MIPTAKEMADAIWANTHQLIEAEILAEECYEAANALCTQLKSLRDSQSWTISVPFHRSFVFRELFDDDGLTFKPHVSVENITTDPANSSSSPFSRLDIALFLEHTSRQPVRWHFDMANKTANPDGIVVYQPGPLFHMQFGGHNALGKRSDDFWLSEPRWCHPPMDLILLLEAVAANFFPEQWAEQLRKDASWCERVSQSERLCLTTYVKTMDDAIKTRTRTVLGQLWAGGH